MNYRVRIRKLLVSGASAWILFAGFLWLIGFEQGTARVAAKVLGTEIALSASTTVTNGHTIYLPTVRGADKTVTNVDFETDPPVWIEYSTNDQSLILPAAQLPVQPNSGQWAARFGGINNEISMISQAISIEAGNACLTYQVWIQSGDNCKVDFGGVGVNGKWFFVEDLCAGTATGRWVPRHISMTEKIATPVSPTIVLNLAASTDYSIPSTMLIDDIAFQGTSLCNDSTKMTRVSNGVDQLIGQQIVDRNDFQTEQ